MNIDLSKNSMPYKGKRRAVALMIVLAALMVLVVMLGIVPNGGEKAAEAATMPLGYEGYIGSAPSYSVRSFLIRSYRDYYSNYDDMVFGIKFSTDLSQTSNIKKASLYYIPVSSTNTTFTADAASGYLRTSFIERNRPENFQYYNSSTYYTYPNLNSSTWYLLDMYDVFEYSALEEGKEYAVRCVVDFDSDVNGSTLHLFSSEFRFVYKTRVVAPATPFLAGHTFVGWYYDADLSTPYVTGDVLHTDTVLYPKYEMNTYNVSIHNNITSVVELMDDVVYDTVLEPTYLPGYNFIGWYTDSSYINAWDGKVNDNLTIYSKYDLSIFNLNVFGFNKDLIYTNSYSYNTNFNIASLSIPTVEGYNFAGWYLDAGFTIPASASININQEISIYAKYEIAKFDVVIYGYNNEIILEVNDVDYNTLLNSSEIDYPSVVGHTFSGWYINSNFTIPFSSMKLKSDISIYAKYTKNLYNYIVYGFNGDIIKSGEVEYGSILNVTAPNIMGKTFKDWYIDSSYSNFYDLDTPIIGDITIYAEYVDLNYYVYMYGFDGFVNLITVSQGAVVPVNERVPEAIDGYIFDGWYSDYTYTNLFNFNVPIQSDLYLYAKYHADSYNIKVYGGVYGDILLDTIIVNHGELLNIAGLTAPAVDGYEFIEWQNLGHIYNFSLPVVNNLSLKAYYKLNTYTVSIYNYDGTVLRNITKGYGSVLSKENLFINDRVGYSLVGWFTDVNFINSFDIGSFIIGSLNLYPKYSKKLYSYKIYGFNGLLLQSDLISHGSNIPVIELVAPPIDGYSFNGWYIDSTYNYEYNTSLPMTGDINIYSSYIKNKFNVSVYGMNNNLLYSGKVSYGENLPEAALNVYDSTGYIFEGWYTDLQKTNRFNVNSVIFNNISLYANYDKVELFYKVYGFNNNLIKEGVVLYDDRLPSVEAPVIVGYSFLGWYLDSSYVNKFNPLNNIQSDVYLYAKYTNESYDYIIYGYNNDVLSSGTYYYGSLIAEPVVYVPEGLAMLGWYRDAEMLLPYNFEMSLVGNVSIYAKIGKPIINYSIFGFNGEVLQTGSYRHNDLIQIIDAPEVEGYTFIGWYTDQDYINAFDSSIPGTGETAIYAKYLPNEEVAKPFNWKALVGGLAGGILLIGLVVAFQQVFGKKKRKF